MARSTSKFPLSSGFRRNPFDHGDYNTGSFELARADGLNEEAKAYRESRNKAFSDQLSKWVATKKNSASFTESQTPKAGNSQGPYKPIRDQYGIRVLEIHPGEYVDPMRASLVHCNVEFEYESVFLIPGTSFIGLKTKHAMSADLEKLVFYTALSYTWGSSSCDTKIECDGHILSITLSLETALRHFRRTDHAIVMWIDQICIDQTKEEEKKQQIPLMPKIYSRALNTAIRMGLALSFQHRLRPHDKVFGLLGVCEQRASRASCIARWRPCSWGRRSRALRARCTVYNVLIAVDHDPEGGMPSWCPDWTRERVTDALGYFTSTLAFYGAGGDEDPDLVVGAGGRELTVAGKVFDLAGKDESGKQRCPESWSMIFSLLLDECSGSKYSLPDQVYDRRQEFPDGDRGKVTVAHLGNWELQRLHTAHTGEHLAETAQEPHSATGMEKQKGKKKQKEGGEARSRHRPEKAVKIISGRAEGVPAGHTESMFRDHWKEILWSFPEAYTGWGHCLCIFWVSCAIRAAEERRRGKVSIGWRMLRSWNHGGRGGGHG